MFNGRTVPYLSWHFVHIRMTSPIVIAAHLCINLMYLWLITRHEGHFLPLDCIFSWKHSPYLCLVKYLCVCVRNWRNSSLCPSTFLLTRYLVPVTTEFSHINVSATLSHPKTKKQINGALYTPHVTSKHTVASWKGCIGYLCKICMRVTNDPHLLKKKVELIESTVLAHNILIQDKNPAEVNKHMGRWTRRWQFSQYGRCRTCPKRGGTFYRGTHKWTKRKQLKVHIRKDFFRVYNCASGADSDEN